ncbi:MAG TPA: alanine dehydrogenase [Caldilineae bacterium]|nr:alanine dehydrogenase [Caldilineae bacterium]
MRFGVPKERQDQEMRVGLTPAGVHTLVDAGHVVYVERNAGLGAGFSDEDYREAGAEIVYSAEETYGRAEVIVKAARPTREEHHLMRPGQTLLCFLHLAVASRDLTEALEMREVTAIAYEMIEEDDGTLSVLMPTSELAGRLAPMIASELLSSHTGGRGILLSGMHGVPPAEVVILGAGVVGSHAARCFSGLGAHVTVLDHNPRRLQQVDSMLRGRVVTLFSSTYNLRRVVRFADVLVGCVLVPGARSPVLVTREMVQSMRPRAVIIDFSIDHGGCVATSRPTTHRDPFYIEEGVVHYCVPNAPARVARSASHALTNAALPYLLLIGQYGVDGALERSSALRRGVNVLRGRLLHPHMKEGQPSSEATTAHG